jgi:hypothetical protein
MNPTDLMSRIQTDMTAAMKSKDAETLSTLRMLKTALMEARTKKPKDAGLTPDEEIEILQRYVKKRREAIEEFAKVGRADLAPKEEREIAVTMRYLPLPVGEEELKTIVRDVIAQVGATSPKDLGKVMGPVLAKVKGRADGGQVSKLVREALGG